MNKTRFRLLVFFMSLSLIGIILVQLYWVNSSLKDSDEQFKFTVKQILGNVSYNLKRQQGYAFLKIYDRYTDSVGHPPSRQDLLPYYENNIIKERYENIIYSDNVTGEDYQDLFFDKEDVENFARSRTIVDNSTANAKKPKSNVYNESWQLYRFEGYIKDFKEYNSLESWLSKENLERIIATELDKSGVSTDF